MTRKERRNDRKNILNAMGVRYNAAWFHAANPESLPENIRKAWPKEHDELKHKQPGNA